MKMLKYKRNTYALKTTWPPRSAVEDSSWSTKAQYDSSSPWKHNIMLSFLPHSLLNTSIQ